MYHQVIVYPAVPLMAEIGFDVSVNYQQPQPGMLLPFVHLEVHEWSPSNLRRLKALWPSVRSRLPPIVFCCGTEDDKKHQKFVAHFGWKPLSQAHCSDGKDRMTYVHYR